MGILILVAAVGVLGVFLFSTFAEFKKPRVVLLLELSLFFALYILTLWMSGLHTSNYKFLFLFVVIYYTIAHSKQMGFLVAAGGSALVLGLDLFTGNSQDVNVYFQQDLALVVSFFVVAQCLGLFVRVQREYAAYLEECARMDGLTGVYNHRSFHQLLEAAYAASVATGAPLSVIMMDIDFFKKYNDLYGHQQGDEVLRSIAAEVGRICARNRRWPATAARSSPSFCPDWPCRRPRRWRRKSTGRWGNCPSRGRRSCPPDG